HPPGQPRREGRDFLSPDRPGAADPAHRPAGAGQWQNRARRAPSAAGRDSGPAPQTPQGR
ncbi:hypothetical protein LCE32_35645, partial [Streptomyces sp. 7G]|nr:hypothetical protein [Streptomyces sp. 7G]